MSGRDIFSKHLPNIKLATRFDSDGNEIDVEKREDEEQNKRELEIFDILVSAGYYRARIKGLSAFDKIVGGMTWCIEACDYDVDVDLLFHENLTIGQKISLTEKIVVVLPQMKCPYSIEPHQIQGLDFINIHPVIQWLVKKSVENRAEKAERLKRFAIGQFHNHFSLNTDNDVKIKNIRVLENINKVEKTYGPKRQHRKKEAAPNDERSRVILTLLEYGDQSFINNSNNSNNNKKYDKKMPLGEDITEEEKDFIETEEIDVDQLLKNLSNSNEENMENFLLNETDIELIKKNKNDLKLEMLIDSKTLSAHNKLKTLEQIKNTFDKKLNKLITENANSEVVLKNEHIKLNALEEEKKVIQNEIMMYEEQEKSADLSILDEIQLLVSKNEKLKQEEIKFKEQCRQEIADLQKKIKESEEKSPDDDIKESEQLLEYENEKLQALRTILAKKNRAIVVIQRKLDNIPDRTELAQYQKRFLELYNQVSSKHRETKQYYTLYNTLDDTKLYLEKELSFLNSIYENYNEALKSNSAREQFMKQFEQIVDGIKQNKYKITNKCDEEKLKRDNLNAELLILIEEQRKYALAVKQLTKEYQKNEILLGKLNKLKI